MWRPIGRLGATGAVGITYLILPPPEVDAVLGVGTTVDYNEVQLANPWKSEAFRLEDGTPTVILYYVTACSRARKRAEPAAVKAVCVGRHRSNEEARRPD